MHRKKRLFRSSWQLQLFHIILYSCQPIWWSRNFSIFSFASHIWQRRGGKLDKTCHEAFLSNLNFNFHPMCALYVRFQQFNCRRCLPTAKPPHCRHSERWTLFRLRALHDIGVVMICRRNFATVGTSWAQILIFHKNSCAGLRRRVVSRRSENICEKHFSFLNFSCHFLHTLFASAKKLFWLLNFCTYFVTIHDYAKRGGLFNVKWRIFKILMTQACAQTDKLRKNSRKIKKL